jgi:cysteinyl-tRNA synthetase
LLSSACLLPSILISLMLRLYNTASRSIQPIDPIVPGKIGMYCCGQTVYRHVHIGHLRAYVMEDVLRRSLEYIEGYEVRHVMNVTDVGHLVGDENEGEDKMEKSSKESGESAWDIARRFEKIFFEDLERMNVESPSAKPRATEHIQEQIELIKTLETKGFTYRISDGIYFDTSKFPSYGRLSGQTLAEKQEGARVEANREKKNPTDFALWKFSPTDQKRQMEWESPWGLGFPGWHVECSAMSRKELGQPFDIHCGGVDHIPVHHENEIAQSEAAFGVPLVNCWMHVEFLTIEGEKMSNSVGNTFSLDDLGEKGISPVALRLFFLGASYRAKQNFTWESVNGIQHAYEKLIRTVKGWEDAGEQGIAELEIEFRNAIEDDLNTPKALAVLWKLVDSDHDTASKRCSLQFMDKILGLGIANLKQEEVNVPEEIQQLAEDRMKAKAEKNWTESDRLREMIASKGWDVRDEKEGYRLEKNSNL